MGLGQVVCKVVSTLTFLDEATICLHPSSRSWGEDICPVLLVPILSPFCYGWGQGKSDQEGQACCPT